MVLRTQCNRKLCLYDLRTISQSLADTVIERQRHWDGGVLAWDPTMTAGTVSRQQAPLRQARAQQRRQLLGSRLRREHLRKGGRNP